MRKTPNLSYRALPKGFTIVEIMVASLVMALLVTGIISITVNFIKSYNNASAKLSSNYVARSVLDFMERDLESAVFRNNGNVWMVAEYERTGLSNNIRNGRFPIGKDDGSGLFFFSTPQDSTLPGAVTALSYTLRGQRPLRGVSALPEGAAALYRNLETPEDTFETVFDLADDIDGLLSEIQFTERDRADFYLTDSVHDLSIRFYVDEIGDEVDPNQGPYLIAPNSDGRIIFPSQGAEYFQDKNVDGIPDGSPRTTQTTINSPDFIEIDIRILSDELKQLLEVIDGGFTTLSQSDTDDAISRGIESFHKRIQIYGSGL